MTALIPFSVMIKMRRGWGENNNLDNTVVIRVNSGRIYTETEATEDLK